MRLYQAEWCPFSHRVRAKLTELGIDYEIVNISASGKRRAKLEEVAGTKAIPVLVDRDRIITDSDEALSYLEYSYETDPEELELHRRELRPLSTAPSLSGSRRPQRDCARTYRKRVSRCSRSWTSPPIRKVKDCTRC